MRARLSALIAGALLCAQAPSAAADWFDRFRDSNDGKFDLSDYLLRHRGVLPIPMVITEPAVGYGGGVALAYFSQSFEERAEASRARGEPVVPPDISLAAVLGTENGTWGAAAGHMGFWDGDRWRYVGAVATAEMFLDYYGVSGNARAYELKVGGLLQQITRRIGTSNWFAGPRFAYARTRSTFEAGTPGDVPARSLDTSIGIMSLIVTHDGRDNIFTPNKGNFLEVEAGFARGAFGSDSNFQMLNARAFSWHPVGDFVLGVRGDARASSGDVPFYLEPYVALRGVRAARYQDKNALVAEFEARWNLDSRWAVVGFGGVGKAYGRRQSWSESETVGGAGAGFRYLVARKLGLYAGIDVARGSEDTIFYITAGSAWR